MILQASLDPARSIRLPTDVEKIGVLSGNADVSASLPVATMPMMFVAMSEMARAPCVYSLAVTPCILFAVMGLSVLMEFY